jgi:hypothetical protein
MSPPPPPQKKTTGIAMSFFVQNTPMKKFRKKEQNFRKKGVKSGKMVFVCVGGVLQQLKVWRDIANCLVVRGVNALSRIKFHAMQ